MYTRDDTSNVHYFDVHTVNGLFPLPDIATGQAAAFALKKLTESELWHLRMGHCLSHRKLHALSRRSVGMPTLTHTGADPCSDCGQANITRAHLPPQSPRSDTGVVNLDLVDMGDCVSLAGSRYMSIFTFVDKRFCTLFTHKTKDEAPPGGCVVLV